MQITTNKEITKNVQLGRKPKKFPFWGMPQTRLTMTIIHWLFFSLANDEDEGKIVKIIRRTEQKP